MKKFRFLRNCGLAVNILAGLLQVGYWLMKIHGGVTNYHAKPIRSPFHA